MSHDEAAGEVRGGIDLTSRIWALESIALHINSSLKCIKAYVWNAIFKYNIIERNCEKWK